jgi:tetratricopeptide (TPR) repeat protein
VKKFRAITIFLLLTLLWKSTQGVAQDLQKAKDLLQQGDTSAAVELLRKVVKKNKNEPEAYLLLGETLIKADSSDQALVVLVQAREIIPTVAQVYVLLGDAYMQQKLYPAAVQQYEEATRHDSTKAEIFLKVAEANMKIRKYKEAVNAYQAALALDTTNTETYRKLGNLLFSAKLYKNAIPYLEKVVARDSNAGQEQTQLVKSYFEVKRYEDLVPLAEKLTQTDSLNGDLLKILAAAYAKKRPPELEKAMKIFQQFAAKDSLQADDYIEYGRVLKLLEKTDEAVGAFEKAFSMDSTETDVYYDLGSLYMKQKRYAEAIGMFERKIASDTTAGYQFASYLNAGLCLMQLKDFKKALQYILKSLELRPDYVQGWSSLGNCYAQMDSVEQKIQAYRKVIELATAQNSNGTEGKYNSQLKEAFQMIGVQHLLDKKYGAAIDSIKKSLQFDPKDCNLNLWLAQAYHNTNNKEEATKYYKKVLEVCAKNSSQRDDAKKGLQLLGVVVD